MTRCLIVDDEEPARELIRLHLSGMPGFEVVDSLNNALDAFAFLQKNAVDLIFLDIRMPKMSGLELARLLKPGPKIILTTAYREYAADAYEIDVFDYLVKPVTQERFLKTIAKYNQYQGERAITMNGIKDDHAAYMFFKVGRGQVKILLDDILYIEGLSDYIKVHTKERFYIASEKLGYMEEKLPSGSFMRIHKSYIIAMDKVSSFNTMHVTVNNQALPLGRVFKSQFQKRMVLKAGPGFNHL